MILLNLSRPIPCIVIFHIRRTTCFEVWRKYLFFQFLNFQVKLFSHNDSFLILTLRKSRYPDRIVNPLILHDSTNLPLIIYNTLILFRKEYFQSFLI